MNAILVILLTGFAVLGAYFLADLLAGGSKPRCSQPALVVIPAALSAADAAQIFFALREILPQCEFLCEAGEESDLPATCCGYDHITFAQPGQLEIEAARRVHLQTREKSV